MPAVATVYEIGSGRHRQRQHFISATRLAPTTAKTRQKSVLDDSPTTTLFENILASSSAAGDDDHDLFVSTASSAENDVTSTTSSYGSVLDDATTTMIMTVLGDIANDHTRASGRTLKEASRKSSTNQPDRGTVFCAWRLEPGFSSSCRLEPTFFSLSSSLSALDVVKRGFRRRRRCRRRQTKLKSMCFCEGGRDCAFVRPQTLRTRLGRDRY